MKKMLIHGEYLCVLNLIALPFFVMFYNKGSLMIWPLMILLDVAELMLMIDERKFMNCIMDAQWKTETQRIKIYLAAILALYVYIGIVQSWILLLYLLINDGLSSILSYVVHTYVFKNHNDDEEV